MKSILPATLCSLFISLLSSCANDIPTVDAKPVAKKKVATTTTSTKKYNSFLPSPASASTRAKASKLTKDKHGMPTYSPKHRKRYVRTTAYSHMENEPGAPGRKNAKGTILKYGSKIRSAAADWSLYPVGTKFKIKGLPYTYVVDDYGSALVGTNTIDIYHPTLRSMNRWGTRNTEITVIQWGSTERTIALLKGRTRYKHCRRMYYGALKNKDKFLAAR